MDRFETKLQSTFCVFKGNLEKMIKNWGYSTKFLRGGSAPKSKHIFVRQGTPFVYPLLTNCRYPFTYRFRGVASPFWRSLPEKAVIGSNVIAPWDPKSPETFFLLFHKELRNAHSFLSSLCTVGSDTQASSCLNVPGKPRTPIPEECRTLAVACVAGVERGRG